MLVPSLLVMVLLVQIKILGTHKHQHTQHYNVKSLRVFLSKANWVNIARIYVSPDCFPTVRN